MASMVRETRHLWVGNLPDNIREDKVIEQFKRWVDLQLEIEPWSCNVSCVHTNRTQTVREALTTIKTLRYKFIYLSYLPLSDLLLMFI